jgi:two-component system, sensor histidine kinase YesM
MGWAFRTNLVNTTGVTWKNSIFMRIIITFVAILLPLYMLGIFIYNSSQSSVREEISSSMISQVTFYMDGLEKEVQRILYLEYDMINDTNLDRLSAIPEAMSDIDKMQAIKNLQNRLEAVRSSSMYISNLTVYIPSINRTITDRGVDELDLASYEELISTYNPLTEIQYMKDSPVILTESPFMDNITQKPMFIFKLELSRQAFADALQQFNKYAGSGSFLINSQTKKNIGTSNIATEVESQIIDRLQSGQQGILPMENNSRTVRGMYIYTKSAELGMTLAMYVPEDVVFEPIRQYQKWFWIFTIAAAAIIVIFSLSMYRFIHKPLIELVGAFEKVEEGDLNIAIEHHHKDEFRYLYRRFNAMVENLGTLIKQVYTMKILTQKAELKQLQSQINPHFLYNSFFILHRRIKSGDYDNAMAFSQQLGNYFRFITRSADDEVPLEREVEHAHIYADIQTIRFSSRITVEFGTLPEDCRNIAVPRLILQPIIENAFEHGLENKVSGGLLRIDFERMAEIFAQSAENTRDQGNMSVSIVVEDNGENLEDAELERLQAALSDGESQVESTGIINIHRRLRLKFGEGSGLAVSRSALGGFRVVVNIVTSGGVGNV